MYSDTMLRVRIHNEYMYGNNEGYYLITYSSVLFGEEQSCIGVVIYRCVLTATLFSRESTHGQGEAGSNSTAMVHHHL